MVVPSIRKLAEALGLSHTILNRHLKDGKFSALPGGGFDVDQVREQLTRRVDLAQSRKVQMIRPAAAASSPAPVAPAPPAAPAMPELLGNAHEIINKARAKREVYKAAEAELDLKERQRELVPLAKVNTYITGMIIAAREEALQIGPELRDKLARETDPVICEELVDRRIRRLLDKLSEYRPNA